MLLSVPPRSALPALTYNKGGKKQPYVPPAQPLGPPSPSPAGGGTDQLSKTNLYIRGLHPGTTDQDLVKLCQPYGKIVSTKAILDKTTNKCKGYGFVDFDSPTAAQKAVTALKASGVQAQMAKQQEQDPTNLYISNLPPGVDEQELEALLKPFGTVVSTRILRDPHGASRGVGFARREMRSFGVQVSIIEPGGFRTAMTDPAAVLTGYQRLWERLPAETQAAYGHHYLESYARSTVLLHRLSSSRLSRVTGAVAHALLSRRPRSRYAVGWDARLLLLPLSYCPAWLADAAIGLLLRLPAAGTP
ncbi:hypothetical protein AV530_008446 [Patagioenas fasciata monilis]|uniref:RRM domain-containing protein n=1 Tax=Patagioenas fasciata monilis TaxID=372326 RepID=A0A1V4JDX5_PATFA|nr:hypothetical protein AV530_008446 [Patagioenas fasciata monilis]